MGRAFQIIHEDDTLLVVNKPAGLVCHPTKPDGFSSLISRLKTYLGPSIKPHLINRLDRETSGVVVVTKKLKAARELNHLWLRRKVHKEYLAIVHGAVRDYEGLIDAPLGPDVNSIIKIKDKVRPDGLPAKTAYRLEQSLNRKDARFSLLRIWPTTGRKHQIRIHLAHMGHPVVGDKLYGHEDDCYLAFAQNRLTHDQKASLMFPFHALHSLGISLYWNRQAWIFRANLEAWFTEFLSDSSC